MDWFIEPVYSKTIPKIVVYIRGQMAAKISNINQITMVEPSPEKAGVGGSIPSLATI